MDFCFPDEQLAMTQTTGSETAAGLVLTETTAVLQNRDLNNHEDNRWKEHVTMEHV